MPLEELLAVGQQPDAMPLEELLAVGQQPDAIPLEELLAVGQQPDAIPLLLEEEAPPQDANGAHAPHWQKALAANSTTIPTTARVIASLLINHLPPHEMKVHRSLSSTF